MTAGSSTIPANECAVLVGKDVDGRHGGDETGDVANVVERDNSKRSRCH